MMKQTPPTDQYNQSVYNLIPGGCRKILEIGTGSGSLAAAVKQREPGVEYVGVELDADYLELSRSKCDRVHLANFEEAGEEVLSELGNTDLVLFCDVLEHFRDPWQILRTLKARMRPGSQVIASIPNIQHWSIQLRLNIGDWRYAENGLLDQTHLRFFTRSTMVELFEKSGFTISHLEPRIFDFPNQNAALGAISEFTRRIGGDPQTSVQDAAAFQYVIVATPQVQ